MSKVTINKVALGELVAEKLELSNKDGVEAVEAVFGAIQEALVEGNDVNIAGFGKLELRHRAARQGFNPATKEPMEIKASNAVGFKAAKALRDSVNK